MTAWYCGLWDPSLLGRTLVVGLILLIIVILHRKGDRDRFLRSMDLIDISVEEFRLARDSAIGRKILAMKIAHALIRDGRVKHYHFNESVKVIEESLL